MAGSFLVSSTASSDRRLVTRGLVLCYDTYSQSSYPGSGTTLYDLKGNSNATLSGVSISNKYASFDGSSSYASFSTSPFNFASNQTIVMVLKPMETDGQRRNPYNHEYAGYGTITHETTGDFNYYFGTSGGNGATYQGVNSSFTVKENEMAVITLVRSPSTITWYKNGVAGGSVANSYPTALTSVSTAYLGEGYAGFYKGEINFFALYNTALTAAEVLQNYNALYERLPIGTATSGLIFEYDFSNTNYYGGTGPTSVTDTSGNANNMTWNGTPSFSTDNGGSIVFDGSSNYGTVTATQLASASVVTIDLWAKWINVNNANNGMFCGFTTYDIWTAGGSLGYNTGAGDLYGLTSSQVNSLNLAGNYHHYAFVMTKSGSIPSSNQIWIDGVLQTMSQVYGTTTTPPGYANNLFALANWINGGYYGNIAVSNVRMYNRQLSSTEIIGNYNAIKNKFALPVQPTTAPTIGTATAITNGATVSFTPASNQPPSDYFVISNPGNFVGLGDTSPISVTGLSSSTSYTFQVGAINGAGPSSLSFSSSAVTPLTAGKAVNVLVVGGGGAGGSSAGGGGGAGGYVASTYNALITSYSVVVGAGGNATPTNGNGNAGNASSALGYTALGGGQGTAYGGGNGGNGGSGGGGGCQSTSQLGGSTTQNSTYGYGTGNNGGGGSSYTDANYGGGGGGAGSAGTSGVYGGAGGSGLTYQINGSNYGTYAAGGPGGQAGTGQSAKPNATANTGNGGSGSGDNATAGSGGSGIVIISYPTGSLTATGGSISTFNGYTVHTFTSIGTSTWTRTA